MQRYVPTSLPSAAEIAQIDVKVNGDLELGLGNRPLFERRVGIRVWWEHELL